MKKIRVLLVGLGRIGQSLESDPLRRKPCTHAGTLFSARGRRQYSLMGVVDTRSSQLEDFFQRFPELIRTGIRTFTEFPTDREFLERIDLAVIATSSSSHSELIRKCIHSGIRNILVEKPFALSYQEGVKLKKLSRKNGVRLWVNHERRYHPIYKHFRDELISGRLGKILRIQASVLTSKLDPGHAFSPDAIGPLYHDGTHAVDFIQWVLGEPVRIHSKLTKSNPRYKVEERAVAWMEFRNDVEVFLEVGGYRRYFQFEIDIQTDTTRILLGNDGFRFWKTEESKLYKGFRSLAEHPVPISSKVLKDTNPFPILYDSIYHSIRNDLPPETGSIEDNVSILKILDRIRAS